MMTLHYDEDFVEAAAFLCASGRRRGIPPLQIQRFHHERERAYAVLDPDDRNAAFFAVHLEWFREWGFEEMLTAALKEFPIVTAALKLLAFRQARGRKDEGSELYVNTGNERHGVIALRVTRFEDDIRMGPFLRHELMHLSDMLDPRFGYSPVLQSSNQTAPPHLIRERYRLLWDVSIDGRLTAAGRPTLGNRDLRWTEFNRGYSFWPEAKREEIFQSLWFNPRPRHAELIALAADPRDLAHHHEPMPGGPCPLCGFVTFDWTDISQIDQKAAAAIQREFPNWQIPHGACSRCVEIYQSLDIASHQPDTVITGWD